MFIPTGDKLIIEEIVSPLITAGGIHLSETNLSTKTAKVIAVGEGRIEFGVLFPVKVKPGDTVIYIEKYAATFMVQGVKRLMIEEKNIIGYIEA